MAGGQESMSQAVHFAQLRNGIKFGDAALKGRIISEEILNLTPWILAIPVFKGHCVK